MAGSVAVITPTADQPTGMRLLESFLRRQTIQPDWWIIVDDGDIHAATPDWEICRHYKRRRVDNGARSLAGNLLAALYHLPPVDHIVIAEHDDYYFPNHIEVCVRRLQDKAATGYYKLRYYNVLIRKWLQQKNTCGALHSTALRYSEIPRLKAAASEAYKINNYGIDQIFWSSLPLTAGDIHQEPTMVGIKGLPGRFGLGIGHTVKGPRWHPDPNMRQLRTWIGKDAELYAPFYGA